MQQQDLQQIKQLLKEEFDQRFKENNKILKEEIVKDVNDKIEEVMLINKEEFEKVDKKFDEVDKKFDEVDKRFDEVNGELKDIKQGVQEAKKVQENIYGRICDQNDNKLVDLDLDMDKVKYIHSEEWDKLPPTREISEALAEKGLKEKM